MGSLPRLSRGMGDSVGLSNEGLEREINFFNRLEGSVCATCAPGDQENLAIAKVNRLSEVMQCHHLDEDGVEPVAARRS